MRLYREMIYGLLECDLKHAGRPFYYVIKVAILDFVNEAEKILFSKFSFLIFGFQMTPGFGWELFLRKPAFIPIK